MDGVTGIGKSAFSDCSGLTSIVLPKSVTSIGSYAFSGCTALKNVTISSGVTTIGKFAFWSCRSLTTVTIPDTVTAIGESAFFGCCRLVEVYNQSELGVTVGSTENGYVGYYAKVVYTEPYTTKLSTDENGYILYTDGDTVCLIGYIGTETNLTLPGNITEINQYAFKWCGNLTSVTMPDSVTAIGTSAFQGCDGLTHITYAGTMAQWNAIAKSDLGWRGTVICSDGTVAVQ